MLPALQSVIALQALDSAADAARRRLAELPAAADAIAAREGEAGRALDAVKSRVAANHDRRRALEKDVAAVESRLARFNDHKAAVKTNQEYTALLHEISTATTEKEQIEEQILLLMEEADGLTADERAANAALADTRREGAAERAALDAEGRTLQAELARLADERARRVADIDARTLTTYEQLLRMRRGVAVARMIGETCAACHVRLRPHVAQMIRRNEAIVPCESCQRILYFEAPAPDERS
jgi:predicted  nucleic acid-binding Zn-ribbon protein